MSKHIKFLLGVALFTAGLSGYASAGVAPAAAALLLHGQSANGAMSYPTQAPCPDQDLIAAAHPGAAKPHKIATRPHPKPKPKLQPVAVVHAASEAAPVSVKKVVNVVHVKRKPKPKPSFAPLALAANKNRMSPIPVAASQSLLSRSSAPPSLCETIHRGEPEGPVLVSNTTPPTATPSAPELPLLSSGPTAPGSEASLSPNAFSEPFNSGPVGLGGGGGPPGAIGSGAQNPPESGGTAPPTETAPVSPIPEPSDWALMMFGLGAIGYGLRVQRRADRKSQTSLAA
jgi:hypothetical protein